ncbi:MAG: hypothetical protein M1546_20235 [Chloroflexi bacterium]|nr:hypothetical protein [Chloroflexota bacterium]
MDIRQFKDSLATAVPSASFSNALQALWYDAKGDWQTAHTRAQAQADSNGAWVHAYLHRKEGDLSNAAYWYRRAGKPVASVSLEDEWETLVTTLLA